MRYFQVSFDVETTGLKNSIHQIKIEKETILKDDHFMGFRDFFSSKNLDFWHNQDKIQSFNIPIIKGEIIKNAKLTDIMGYTPSLGFFNDLYSEKFIDIIKAFNIGNYAKYEVSIENITEKYYLLFIETILSREINFRHSLIYTGHKTLKNVEYFSFSNYNEYWDFLQNNPLARFEKVSISKQHLGKDIIKIQGPLPFYSEKLIDFLLDCGITGLQVSYNNSVQLQFV